MLDDLKAYAVLLRSLGSVWSGVALIHTCQFHRTSGDLLRLFGEHRNLLPIALVGRSHRQGQQMSKGIDGDVDLRPFAPLGPIVSCPGPRLGCGLQRAAVDIHRRRLALASAPFAQQRPHILYQQLKTAGLDLTLHLLIDHPPGRQIARQKTPLITRSSYIANRVEHRPQIMLLLRTVLTAEQQIRQHKRPLFILHITWVRPASRGTAWPTLAGHRP